jgi:hypothetical protein
MSATSGPTIVSDGLSLYLDAANPKSYSGSGNTWFDISGNGYNWTLVNTPSYNSLGYFRFNGTNQYAQRSGLKQSLDNTNNTFSMWFRPVSTPTANRPVWSDNFGPEVGIWIDQSNNVRAYVYGGSTAINVPNNTWVNICFSYFSPPGSSGLQYQFSTYVNGNLLQLNLTGTVGNGLNDMPLNIARDPGQNFLSNIDVSIWQHWTRRLTDSEVQQNFNAFRGRYNL